MQQGQEGAWGQHGPRRDGGNAVRAAVDWEGEGMFHGIATQGAEDVAELRASPVGAHLIAPVGITTGEVKTREGYRVKFDTQEKEAIRKTGVAATKNVMEAALDVEDAEAWGWNLVVAVDGSKKGEGDGKRVSYGQWIGMLGVEREQL